MKKVELEKEIEKLKEKMECVQRRHDYLLTELVGLNQGLGVKPFWYKEGVNTWNDAMQHKAGLALDKVSKMRLL